MDKISIKPLSVNKAYSGKRTASKYYRKFKVDIAKLLRPLKVPDGNLKVSIEFGFSNLGSDIDNPVKTFLDSLQAKYDFNDNRVYELNVTKLKAKKGGEYIKFKIEALEHSSK